MDSHIENRYDIMSLFIIIVDFLNHLYFKFAIAKTRFLRLIKSNKSHVYNITIPIFQYIGNSIRNGTSRFNTKLLRENCSCKLVLKCNVFLKNIHQPEI